MSLKGKALWRIALDKMGILSRVYFRYHGQTLRGVPYFVNFTNTGFNPDEFSNGVYNDLVTKPGRRKWLMRKEY